MPKVFAGRRKEFVAALLAVGGAAALAACGSDSATYKPAPRYTQQAPAATPSQPTAAQPAPYTPPAKTGGQAGCGMGKCG